MFVNFYDVLKWEVILLHENLNLFLCSWSPFKSLHSIIVFIKKILKCLLQFCENLRSNEWRRNKKKLNESEWWEISFWSLVFQVISINFHRNKWIDARFYFLLKRKEDCLIYFDRLKRKISQIFIKILLRNLIRFIYQGLGKRNCFWVSKLFLSFKAIFEKLRRFQGFL